MARRWRWTAFAAFALGVMCLASPSARPLTRQVPPLRTLDPSTPIPYFIADGAGKTGYRSSDQELARWAIEAWQRSTANVLRFEPASEGQSLVRLYWAEPNEGQYGEMQPLLIGGRRGAAVYIRPDMDALGADIARRAFGDVLLRDSIVYLTCVHELGHALGFPHTNDFRDVMYFFGFGGSIADYFGRYRAELGSRQDIAKRSGLSAADLRRLVAAYP